MVILFRCYGNHSNRLFQNLHFEAFCYEHGVAYTNPTFSDMARYYKEPCDTRHTLQSFCLNLPVLKKLYTSRYIANIAAFNDSNPHVDLYQRVQSGKNVYVKGWYFRVPELSKRYQDVFIQKYTLRSEFTRNNDFIAAVEQLKNNSTTLLGVHIRKTDYRHWMGGKYYFSDDVYMRYIDEFKKFFKSTYGSDCRVILFSDEEVTFATEDMLVSKNEWYIDHYLMSQCDYLIGPPSTFTMWASYMGKVQYCHIENCSGDLSLDNFTCCQS